MLSHCPSVLVLIMMLRPTLTLLRPLPRASLRPSVRLFSVAEPKAHPTGYDHKQLETKWQSHWESKQTFRTPNRSPSSKVPKKYILDMFPYPSGSGLHVGHPSGYTASDSMSRFYRHKGYDVLHPMGWDSFGLPAEQHAINTGTHPAVTTGKNIATFKRQLRELGFSYDWNREIATTDTGYVQWTQWIFVQLFKKGLAAQSEVSVNWCPALGTVLANEEVINGLSERGSHPVERLPLRQWILKIPEYADRLAEGLDGLDWPSGTMTAQRQWIGKSSGCEIVFATPGDLDDITVFTTRPDTIMGVTYLTLAPEHPLISSLTTAENKDSVDEYVRMTSSRSDMDRTSSKEKSGVPTGAYVKHPITGEDVPVWVGDYVLGSYGSGAVMAVPAHDERDFEFAAKFGLGVKEVVSADGSAVGGMENAFTEAGVLVNSGEFDGLTSEEAKAKVTSKLSELNMGGEKIQYKLRDWVFSRQRYWGEPIPIYFPVTIEDGLDPKTSPHTIEYSQPIPVEESDLPLELPPMDDFSPGSDPAGCLARAADWRYFQKDGKWFARETNTMPQWAGSCWYYMRFTDPTNSNAAWSPEADKSWMPVDLYVGGAEHAVLHLLYARFWHQVLFDLGLTEHPEPFKKLVHQGMILGSDGEKMSKSRGNVVNPDDIVTETGADSLRLYEMFMGPLEAVKPWQTSQVQGVVRFQRKVYNVATSVESAGLPENDEDEATLAILHKTMKKVTEDIEAMSFNTAISALMVLTNHLGSMGTPPSKDTMEKVAVMLSPFAPHLAEEVWSMMGNSESLAYEPWVKHDPSLCVESNVKMGVQVNGKVRGEIMIGKDEEDEGVAVDLALGVDKVKNQLEGKEIKKVIYKPGRILNLIVK